MIARELETTLQDVLSEIGVSADDAEGACREMASLLPPIGETEISLIKSNPNISKFQKLRLIRNIRRQKKSRWKKGAVRSENSRNHTPG